jgi:dual specificity tyrosine-phosphorylation-regulated kinase 2/3/4
LAQVAKDMQVLHKSDLDLVAAQLSSLDEPQIISNSSKKEQKNDFINIRGDFRDLKVEGTSTPVFVQTIVTKEASKHRKTESLDFIEVKIETLHEGLKYSRVSEFLQADISSHRDLPSRASELTEPRIEGVIQDITMFDSKSTDKPSQTKQSV